MECFIVQVTPSPTVLWMGIHPSYFIHESNCLLTKKIFSVFFIHGYKSKASNIKVFFFFFYFFYLERSRQTRVTAMTGHAAEEENTFLRYLLIIYYYWSYFD